MRSRLRQEGERTRSTLPNFRQYGGGFIVEADRLRGKSANCKIKTRKEDGETINIIAACATDIMLSNVQFSLKIVEPNKISRVFPGIMDMEINYYRCPMLKQRCELPGLRERRDRSTITQGRGATAKCQGGRS